MPSRRPANHASHLYAAACAAAFSLLLGLSATAATPPSASTPPVTPVKNYLTIGDKPALLFDAPSARANKNFIVMSGTPLEILVKLDKWTKIRDLDGAIGWIDNTTLGERRHVQVSTAFAEVREAASASAPLVFEAQRGVLLEVIGVAVEGWLLVRHRDGQSGFVKLIQIWGD